LYEETAGEFRFGMADDEGVAIPGAEVPKFHSMVCAWAVLAAAARNNGLMNRGIEVMAGWLVLLVGWLVVGMVGRGVAGSKNPTRGARKAGWVSHLSHGI
jgi:hypothetical protein